MSKNIIPANIPAHIRADLERREVAGKPAKLVPAEKYIPLHVRAEAERQRRILAGAPELVSASTARIVSTTGKAKVGTLTTPRRAESCERP